MAPYRDPESGKFVSSAEYNRRTTVAGSMVTAIPAADNAGGFTNEFVTTEASEVIDMGQSLDSNEVFDVFSWGISAAFSLPTTSTAEGSGQASFVVSIDDGFDRLVRTGSYLGINGTPPNREAGGEGGIIDIVQEDIETDGSLVYSAVLAAEASHSDSVNGLAGGGAVANENLVLTARDLGRTVSLDEDDEVYVPHELETRNVSDHDVELQLSITAHGGVRDVDR